MPERDVELVRRMFEDFARRDVEAVVEVAHPDCEFNAYATSRAAGHEGPYVGHDGLRQYFADVASIWDSFTAEPEDFRAVAGSVVIFGRVRATRRGQLLDTAVIWTWRVRDGLVVAGSVFPTPDPPAPTSEPTV